MGLLPPFLLAAHSILDFGAINGTAEDTDIAFKNAYAMTQAIQAANSSENGNRIVLVPKGYSFLMMPVNASELYDVTF